MNNEHTLSLDREADLVACAIQNWYPLFSKYTFKTHLIPFSEEVASWLLEVGVVLPNVDDVVRNKTVHVAWHRVKMGLLRIDEFSHRCDDDCSFREGV